MKDIKARTSIYIDNTEDKPSIVMVSYNRLEATKVSIKSIGDKTNISHNFIVIDNNSIDGTKEYLRSLSENAYMDREGLITGPPQLPGGITGIMYNHKNQGLCAATNIAMTHIKDAYGNLGHFVRINNDVEVMTEGWLETMISFINDDNDIGILVPCYDEPGSWTQQKYESEADRNKYVRCGVGHCMLITDRLLDKGFEWDEKLGVVGPCDIDACMFCRQQGLKVAVCGLVRMRLIDCTPAPEYWSEGEKAKWDLDHGYLRKKYGDEIYDWVCEPGGEL